MKFNIATLLLLVATMAAANVRAQRKILIVPADSFELKINAEKKPQIIDTRLPEEFAINHLLNAININRQAEDYSQKIQQLEKSKPVFLYAIGNARSTQLARELLGNGFTEVYVLDGGIGGWIGQGKPIFTSAKETFSINDFKNILAAHQLVLLDLHTRYCPGCRKVQPVIDSVQNEYKQKLQIVRIDVYDNPGVAGTFKVNAIPTITLYNKSTIVWTHTGADLHTKDIEKALAGIQNLR